MQISYNSTMAEYKDQMIWDVMGAKDALNAFPQIDVRDNSIFRLLLTDTPSL